MYNDDIQTRWLEIDKKQSPADLQIESYLSDMSDNLSVDLINYLAPVWQIFLSTLLLHQQE